MENRIKITLVNGEFFTCDIIAGKTIRQATVIDNGFIDVIAPDGNVYMSVNVNQVSKIELQSRKN